MKQTFDLVSHFFALLPIAVLTSTLYKGNWTSYETKFSLFLLVFLIIASGCSIAYHSVDKTSESFNALHAIDRFTSSTIIILTFWLYIDHIKIPTAIAVLVIFIFVILEGVKVVESVWVEGVLLFLVLIALVVFLLRKCNRCERESGRKRIYELKDPFFGTFFLTQVLAVVFFLADVDPYYHSLWHVFAFISLGSVLIHSLPGEDNNYGQYSRQFYVALLYWLGSLPSRLFISWIFIHMGKGKGWHLAIVFLIFTVPMLLGLIFIWFKKYPSIEKSVMVNFPKMMNTRHKITIVKGSITYLTITILLFTGSVYAAGLVLLIDTLLSGSVWLVDKFYQDKGYTRVTTKPEITQAALNLNNMVF